MRWYDREPAAPAIAALQEKAWSVRPPCRWKINTWLCHRLRPFQRICFIIVMQNVQTIKNCQRIDKHIANVLISDPPERSPVEHYLNRCGSDFISACIDDSQNLNIKVVFVWKRLANQFITSRSLLNEPSVKGDDIVAILVKIKFLKQVEVRQE